MNTMRAIRAHARGGPEQLRAERAPVPVPAADEAVLTVHAAAITFDELLWDESWTRDGVDRTPVIPSHEVSGTVAAVGNAVTSLVPGQDVWGLIAFDRDGAAAEYVAVRAADLALKPASIDHVGAAATALAGLTAWQAIVDHAHLTAGESVLVIGGAGGVGAHVVQLAHHLGARVTATVTGADTADFVEALGADEVFLRTAGGTYDIVIDTVGGPALAAAYANVREGGRLVTLSAPPEAELGAGRNVHDEFFVVRPDRVQLEQLGALIDAGAVRPLVGDTYPLADAAAAYSARGRRGGPGKTVLVVG